MTWHDAEEDVSNLDDEALLLRLFESTSVRQGEPTEPRPRLPDWPERTASPVRVEIDPEIAAWFRSQSPTWRRDINAILRAWIATRPS